MDGQALFEGGTLRGQFVAAIAEHDETAAQRLRQGDDGPATPQAQRDEAWRFLTAGVGWAAKALATSDISDTDSSPIDGSDAAFVRAQHLEAQTRRLREQHPSDGLVASLVERVGEACNRGTELGPIPGGRLGSVRGPDDPPHIVEPVDPDPKDLQAIGSELGKALRAFEELRLGNALEEALALLDHETPTS